MFQSNVVPPLLKKNLIFFKNFGKFLNSECWSDLTIISLSIRINYRLQFHTCSVFLVLMISFLFRKWNNFDQINSHPHPEPVFFFWLENFWKLHVQKRVDEDISCQSIRSRHVFHGISMIDYESIANIIFTHRPFTFADHKVSVQRTYIFTMTGWFHF